LQARAYPVEFAAVQQQLAMAIWNVAKRSRTGRGVGRDVQAKKPHLAVIDSAVSLDHLDLRFAQRLHFGTAQDHAALICVEDLEIAAGPPVGCDDSFFESSNRGLLFALFGPFVAFLRGHS